nr:NADH dehydrogenase subunit 4 [Micranisa ralianga]
MLMMKVFMFIIILKFNIIIWSKKLIIYMMSWMLMLLSLMYMYCINFNTNWMILYSWMGTDYLGYILSLLSVWILSMMFLISMNMSNKKLYSFILLFLLMSLLLSFMVMNYFMFYLWFEISLFPVLLLIMGWGYQPERINASMYMLLYTLFASLPMLVIIFNLYNYYYSLSYLIILNNYYYYKIKYKILFYWFMIFAFLVKLPMFMFHMWLPKAHVEAPVTGSMILAGIMLKLGGYGIMRSMMMVMNYSIKFNYFIMVISLIGMLMLSMVCLRQYDMKLLVAYSSVVHMGMMVIGIMSLMYWGYYGGLIMMIAHGICSSALFMLVNMLYIRTKSRNMFINKGMINLMPSLSLWWFMFCVCNMSSPVSLNLLSELMIINIILNWSMNIMLILMMGMYLSAMYSLFLFSFIQHGKLNSLINFNNKNNKINILEYLNLMLHWIPLNMIIIKMELFN